MFAVTDSTGLPWPAITRKSNRRRLRCILTTSGLRVAKQLCGECPSRLCVSVFTCMCSALFAAIFHQAVPAGAWPGPGDPLTRYLGRRCRATSPYRCIKNGRTGASDGPVSNSSRHSNNEPMVCVRTLRLLLLEADLAAGLALPHHRGCGSWGRAGGHRTDPATNICWAPHEAAAVGQG